MSKLTLICAILVTATILLLMTAEAQRFGNPGFGFGGGPGFGGSGFGRPGFDRPGFGRPGFGGPGFGGGGGRGNGGNGGGSGGCGATQVFSECGSACPATCGDRGDKVCPAVCRSGCVCRTGLILNRSGQCVSPNQC